MNINPSYGTGFARNKAESAFPEMWDSLIGAWVPFLGPAGSLASLPDLSANNNPAEVVNFPLFVGDALDFNGTTQRIVVPDKDIFTFSDGAGNDKPYSVAIWLNMHDTSSLQGVVAKWVTAAREWLIYIQSGSLLIQNYSSSAWIGRSVSLSGWGNKWVLAVFTYDGSNTNAGCKIYLDGERVDSADAGSGSYVGMSNTSTDIGIAWYNEGNLFDGQIREVLLYKQELSGNQAVRLHNNPKGLFIRKPPITYFVAAAAPDVFVPQVIMIR